VTIWRLASPEDTRSVPSEAVYARRDNATDTDLLRKTRDALADVDTTDVVAESVIADRAIEAYHDAVGDVVATMAEDNDLLQHFQQADGDVLRRASLIESRFSFEVYVCRSAAEYELVCDYRAAERAHEFDQSRQLKRELAAIRISVPAYHRTSDTAQKLIKLDTFSHDADERNATERVWTPEARFGAYFDVRTGFDVPESTVEARIL